MWRAFPILAPPPAMAWQAILWMPETQQRRSHPNNMWAEAKSAIVVGMNYGPESNPLEALKYPSNGVISVYAQGRDYHDVIKGRLKELANLLARDTGADVKVFVDTAPLMEKPLAALAGLGWQGKHTNLVSRDYGSWLFLGVILSASELVPNEPEIDHCGSCTSCLDICPTNAFPAPHKIDARRCISYLTIEHKGAIYGCDDCLAICPWNKFAQAGQEVKLAAKEALQSPKLSELAALSEVDFKSKFTGSPIKRIGHKRFLRNVLYAIGNSGNSALKACADAHINNDDPVVRDAALWASKRLI